MKTWNTPWSVWACMGLLAAGCETPPVPVESTRQSELAEQFEGWGATVNQNAQAAGMPVTLLDLTGMTLRPEQAELLAEVPQLTVLIAPETGLTDDHFAPLSNFRSMVQLDVTDNPLTDRGLAALAGMPKLQDVNLAGTRATDATLELLAQCRDLAVLNLDRTAVTAKGLESLTGLRELQQVSAYDTRVRTSDLQRLKELLPKVVILAGETAPDPVDEPPVVEPTEPDETVE